MKLRGCAVLVVAMGLVSSSAWAGSFSALVVFGDSLSDNGNLYSLIGYPPAPYYEGRFSNGPVSSEQLAANLGVPLYDFAVGGATSGVGNYVDGGTQTAPGALGLPGMKAELAEAGPLLGSPLVSSSLFEVWGGANDFLTGGSPTVAAANVDAIVAALEADGAQHILVPGLPDLALTPDFYGVALAAEYTDAFNAALVAGLPPGATYYDTANLLDEVVADPAAYGFSNVTAPCFDGTTVCSDPNQYLFWDGFHPTTAADTILADQFEQAAETPEPGSVLLLGTGLGVLMVLAWRRMGSASQGVAAGGF